MARKSLTDGTAVAAPYVEPERTSATPTVREFVGLGFGDAVRRAESRAEARREANRLLKESGFYGPTTKGAKRKARVAAKAPKTAEPRRKKTRKVGRLDHGTKAR
jgi:hypothetical protein